MLIENVGRKARTTTVTSVYGQNLLETFFASTLIPIDRRTRRRYCKPSIIHHR